MREKEVEGEEEKEAGEDWRSRRSAGQECIRKTNMEKNKTRES
jgi:hypothetical protein